MQKHIADEKTGIPYTLVGDYYLPWGDLPDEEPEQKPIGIWGQRHLRYIKQHRHSLYAELLMTGKLNDYLAELNAEAEKTLFLIVKQMTIAEGITESLKVDDLMEWLLRMKSIRSRADEVIFTTSFMHEEIEAN